jgi:hypothetical protein
MDIKSYLRSWAYDEVTLLADQFSYGHREIALKCMGLDTSCLLLGSLPHGWGPYSVSHPYPKIIKRNFSHYPIFAWSEREYFGYLELGHRNPIKFGSPWAHLVSTIESCKSSQGLEITPDKKESRILFFPSHSVPGSTVTHSDKINQIKRLSGIEKVTVSLFWLDFVNPSIKHFYEAQDCEVVCNGFKGSTGFDSPWTPAGGRVLFLPTLLSRITSHDLIVVDTVSTPFWYAASLGKNVLIFGTGDKYSWWNQKEMKDLQIENRQMLGLVNDHLSKLPFDQVIENDQTLVDSARQELGFEFVSTSLSLIQSKNLFREGVINPKVGEEVERYFQESFSVLY